MENQTMIQAIATLLKEAYEGGNTSFFTDGTGVLDTLSGLSTEQASGPLASGTTIAAHAEHLRWSLANVNNVAAGGEWNPDWKESWVVRSVSEAQWEKLRQDLRREYETALGWVESNQDWSDPMVTTGVLATVAHAAYHLGAMRQMLKLSH